MGMIRNLFRKLEIVSKHFKKRCFTAYFVNFFEYIIKADIPKAHIFDTCL